MSLEVRSVDHQMVGLTALGGQLGEDPVKLVVDHSILTYQCLGCSNDSVLLKNGSTWS